MKLFQIFKKPESRIKTILCIPGLWKDRTEIVTSIAESNIGDYIFAGKILLNMNTNIGFELEISERDERMRESFKWAGMVNRVSDDFLNTIDKHSFVIYIIGESGTIDKAKFLADAGSAILKAGGLGIKVENTGKAFDKKQWTDLLVNYQDSNLYNMYVLDSISDSKETTYSCGMHNLGLKDTIVTGENFQASVELISIFNYYQLIEKPIIESGQTFSTSKDSPVFQILDEKRQPYKGDEYFENPFGMWRLKRK